MGVIFKSDCKLYLGDCLVGMSKLKEKSIDLVLCDLPYGTTILAWDSVIPLEPLWKEIRRVAKDGAAIVLTASQPFTSTLVLSAPDLFKYEMIWEKNRSSNPTQAGNRPLKRHENIVVFSKGSAWHRQADGDTRMNYFPQGLRKVDTPAMHKPRATKTSASFKGAGLTKAGGDMTGYPDSIIRFSLEPKAWHHTQKPVALFEYLINTYSKPGYTVLDMTMGSGTTGVACNNTGRNFIGIEISEEFFEIARRRIGRHARIRILAARAC